MAEKKRIDLLRIAAGKEAEELSTKLDGSEPRKQQVFPEEFAASGVDKNSTSMFSQLRVNPND